VLSEEDKKGSGRRDEKAIPDPGVIDWGVDDLEWSSLPKEGGSGCKGKIEEGDVKKRNGYSEGESPVVKGDGETSGDFSWSDWIPDFPDIGP
jgi:hypothetical protein